MTVDTWTIGAIPQNEKKKADSNDLAICVLHHLVINFLKILSVVEPISLNVLHFRCLAHTLQDEGMKWLC